MAQSAGQITAKDEIGEFCVSTRFGKGKKIRRDAPVPRPRTREEAISQIEELYAYNRWKSETDQFANARAIGLEPKPLDAYTNSELRLILADAEKFRMILYSN